MGAKLFHTYGWVDGQKDLTKLTIAFLNFVNVPKNLYQRNKLLKKKRK